MDSWRKEMNLFDKKSVLVRFGWDDLPQVVDMDLMTNILLESNGVVKDFSALRHLLFTCELTLDVKTVLWPLALGVYTQHSSASERRMMKLVYILHYQHLRDQWQALVEEEQLNPSYLQASRDGTAYSDDAILSEYSELEIKSADCVAKYLAGQEAMVSQKQLQKNIYSVDTDLRRMGSKNTSFYKDEEWKKTLRSILITAFAFKPLEFSQSDVEVMTVIMGNMSSQAMSYWMFVFYMESYHGRYHQPCHCLQGPCHVGGNFTLTRHSHCCDVIKAVDTELAAVIMHEPMFESVIFLSHNPLMIHLGPQLIGGVQAVSQYFQMLISDYVEQCLFRMVLAEELLREDKQVLLSCYNMDLALSLDIFAVSALHILPRDEALALNAGSYGHMLYWPELWSLQRVVLTAGDIFRRFCHKLCSDSYVIIEMEDYYKMQEDYYTMQACNAKTSRSKWSVVLVRVFVEGALSIINKFDGLKIRLKKLFSLSISNNV